MKAAVTGARRVVQRGKASVVALRMLEEEAAQMRPVSHEQRKRAVLLF
jgi:hypothetical protein